MHFNKSKLIPVLYYGIITLLILVTFNFQLSSTDSNVYLFFVFYLLIFLTASELFDKNAGIYVTILIVILQLMKAFASPEATSQSNYFLAMLQILMASYYLVIKKLRARIMEKLTEREKYFRSLVNVRLQPIILKNKKGEILLASESVSNVLGIKNNLKIGKDITHLIHPEDLKIYNKFFKDVVKSSNEIKTVEFRLKKNDKDWIWIKNDAINLLANSRINAIVTSLQDITVQKEIDSEKSELLQNEKKARELAEKAVKDRDEFLSIASHELKTPLTTILLQLQSTLRRISTQSLADFSGETLLKSLQIAEKQSQTLSVLIKDLLNVSMASSGRLTLNKEKIDMVSLVNAIPHKYEAEIALSGCRVKIINKVEELVVNVDPVRIEQALSNIFMNALKYAPGKKVSVGVGKENGFGFVKVKDTGAGIDPSMQKQIFKPFQRANSHTSIKGLGVGLFIANQIVEAHGGNIEIKSDIGKGTKFTMKLPLGEAIKEIN